MSQIMKNRPFLSASGAYKYAKPLIEALDGNGAYQAVKYIDEDMTAKATRRRYKCIKGGFDPRHFEVLLTVGKPNASEREFIKKCRKAREPFPIKKIQLHFPDGQR